jgi:hypothetical protein
MILPLCAAAITRSNWRKPKLFLDSKYYNCEYIGEEYYNCEYIGKEYYYYEYISEE